MLKPIFKDVQDQSATGHYGDILVIFNGLRLMFEVKNKKTLTANDFQKFEDDSLKFDYSIFVSIQTPTDFKVKDNLLYIHGQYVNSQTFTIIK